MRDFNRIELFLETIGELWKKVPDWRFGQLVYNLLGSALFYLEDDEALEQIKSFIAKTNKSSGELSHFELKKVMEEYVHNNALLAKKTEPLTVEEFKETARICTQHIWIKMLDNDFITPAITDCHDILGAVAVWCAGSESDCLVEKDYGTKWLAYLSPPPCWDDEDLPMPHLNGF